MGRGPSLGLRGMPKCRQAASKRMTLQNRSGTPTAKFSWKGRMGSKKEYDLIEAIEAVASEVAPELDIVDVRIVGAAQSPIVRVYIDHADGVSFDLLTSTQKWVGDILDEIEPFQSAYALEVSSPGPDRPLRKPEHFKAAVGKKAKIKTSEPIENRKNFTGTIVSADQNVEIALDEGKPGAEPKVQIAFEFIASANIVPGKD